MYVHAIIDITASYLAIEFDCRALSYWCLHFVLSASVWEIRTTELSLILWVMVHIPDEVR